MNTIRVYCYFFNTIREIFNGRVGGQGWQVEWSDSAAGRGDL